MPNQANKTNCAVKIPTVCHLQNFTHFYSTVVLRIISIRKQTLFTLHLKIKCPYLSTCLCIRCI